MPHSVSVATENDLDEWLPGAKGRGVGRDWGMGFHSGVIKIFTAL